MDDRQLDVLDIRVALRFIFRNLKLCAIAVCMPITWHSDDDVEQVYGLLDVLLDECTP